MKQTTPNAMRLRAKINDYAKKHGIMAQVVLQNYMFECFLARLSKTKYAEKLETIITRSILNTRPRDFYDAYILSKSVQFDPEILSKALLATSEHRGTKRIIENETERRIGIIETSEELKSQWRKYQKKFPYAKDIQFEDTVTAVKALLKI